MTEQIDSRPKAVVFDIGDTLLKVTGFDAEAGMKTLSELAYDETPLPIERAAALSGALHEQFEKVCAETSIEYSQRAFQRLVFDELGVRFRVGPDEIESRYWEGAVSFELEPEIGSALDELRSAGVRMAVISNAVFSGPVLSQELQRRGLLDYFEFVMSSADYGVRKPHGSIFRACLARLGLAPDEAWYVGNIPHIDVEGASGVGMRPVWYNRYGLEATLPDSALEVSSWAHFVHKWHDLRHRS